MKIAVTFENGLIFQHFGHTEYFKIYEAEDGKIISSEIVNTDGSGHSALAEALEALGVNALICGGIGGCARTALAEAGIAIYGGCSGDADAAAEALACGKLDFDPNAKCNHHSEGHHHSDGHSCGGSCGHNCH